MSEYFGHDQWTSFLQHSGTKGMRWGYNYGHPNGKRKAGDDVIEPDTQLIDIGEDAYGEHDSTILSSIRGEELEEWMTRSENMREFTPEEAMAGANADMPEKLEYVTRYAYSEKGEYLGTIRSLTEESKALYQAYTENCSLCSFAYEMRRRGYDVKAGPAYEVSTNQGRVENYFIGTQSRGLNDMILDEKLGSRSFVEKVEDRLTGGEKFSEITAKAEFTIVTLECQNGNQEAIKPYWNKAQKEMAEFPEGSRGFLSVSWSAGSGHSMTWEKSTTGEVIIRDNQWNEIVDPDYLAENICHFSFYRVDNLQYNAAALKYLRQGSESKKSGGGSGVR